MMLSRHHRHMAYRPPHRARDRRIGSTALLWRFIRTYLKPFRGMVALCALLATLEYCGSFYLLAYYSKIVVDSILVIAPQTGHAAEKPRVKRESSTLRYALEKESKGEPRRQAGLDRRLDRGEIIAPRPPGAARRLGFIFALYLLTLIASNLSFRFSARQRIRISQAITARLREDIHDKVMRLSLQYQNNQTPGRLMARILSDVSHVSTHLLTLIISVASQVTSILLGFMLLLIINWRMALILLFFLPFYLLIYRKARPYLKRTNIEISHTNACLYGLVSQKLDGVKMIQAYGREPREALVFHRLAAAYLRDTLAQNRISGASGHGAELLSGMASTGVLFLYGVWQVLHGAITLGQMMYAWGTANALFAPALQLSRLNVTVSNLLVYLNRLAEILDEPITISDAPKAVKMPSPLRQGISINHIRFAYTEEAAPVLQDVSVSIRAGTWLGIMGASGAGKTTLLHLLVRLFEPDAGEIRFDDLPLSNIKLTSLRRQTALVPQEAQILSGTIRDNICYGMPEAEPKDIIAAAQAAELHNFIMQLPVKYETLLGEKGHSLSGGQKQRLSLARALLTKPDILLLDDCTSALDAETERRIQETLSRILAGKTAVIVTQRVSLARRCHKICILENGVITEKGTHEKLIAQQGYYAKLHARQIG